MKVQKPRKRSTFRSPVFAEDEIGPGSEVVPKLFRTGSDKIDRAGIGPDRADPQASWKCALEFTVSSILRIEVVLESLIEVWMVSLLIPESKTKSTFLFFFPL